MINEGPKLGCGVMTYGEAAHQIVKNKHSVKRSKSVDGRSKLPSFLISIFPNIIGTLCFCV